MSAQLVDRIDDLVQFFRHDLGRDRGECRSQGFHGRLVNEDDDGLSELFELPDLPGRFHGEPFDHGIEEHLVVNDVLAGLVLERHAGRERSGDVAFDEPHLRRKALFQYLRRRGVNAAAYSSRYPEKPVVLLDVPLEELLELRRQVF